MLILEICQKQASNDSCRLTIFAVFGSFFDFDWFYNHLGPIFFMPAFTKKFRLKIPILRKIDCSAFYANASAGINFIWDLSVMLPGAKNRFRIFGGILLQIFFYFRLAVLHEIHLDANNPYKYVVSLPIEPHS